MITEPIENYLKDINKAYGRGDSTEHTHRGALARLVEGLGKKVTAINEPKRIECGAPDILVVRQGKKTDLNIGYIETKDIGVNLTQAAKSEQIKKRYLPSLILTDYIEFRWYVEGELRETVRLAEEGKGRLYSATEKSRGKVREWKEI